MDKAQLRRQLRMRLYALGADELRTKSRVICDNLVATVDWSTIHRVSCYRSLEALKEIDTKPIIDYILETWPSIQLDLVAPDTTSPLPSTQYDLIIVPVLGFDDQCNRLGRGGGWYDRFLTLQDHARAIGLALDLQCVDTVPIEEYDVELDEIITESS